MPESIAQPRKKSELGYLSLFVYLTFIGGTVYSDLNFGLRVFHQVLMTALLGGWLIGLLRRREPFPRTRLDLPLAILMGLRFLSGIVGLDPRMSLEFFWRPFIHVVGFYWLVWTMRRQGWRLLVRVLYLTAGVVCVVGVIEWVGWYVGLPFLPVFQEGWLQIGGLSNPIPPTVWRLNFTLTNATALSAYLSLLIPPAVVMAFQARQRDSRIAWWGFVVVALFVQILTQSRGGLLALAVSMPALAAAGWLANRTGWGEKWSALRNTRWFWAAAAAVLILITVAAWILIPGYLSRTASIQVRWTLWRCAVTMIQERPLTGVGIGQYGRALRGCISASSFEYERFTTAHNLYLNIPAESGVLAMLVVGWLMVAALLGARHRWITAGSSRDRLLVGALFAGLVGYAANCLVDTIVDTPVVLPVLLMLAWLVYPQQETRARRRPGVARVAFLAGLMVYLIALLWIDQGQWHFQKSLRASDQGELELALSEVGRARQIDPGLGLYQFQYATVEGLLAADVPEQYLTAAIHDLAQALQLDDTQSLHRANLAALLAQAGNLDLSLQSWRQAVGLNPPDSRFWFNLGAVAERAGQQEEAIRAYARGLALRPRVADSPFWESTVFRQDNWLRIVDLAMTLAGQPAQLCLAIGDLACAEGAVLDPQSGNEFLQLGRVRMAQERWDDASAAIDKAIDLIPSSAGPYVAKAEVAFATGDWETASHLAHIALFVDPYGGARAHYVLGQMALLDGDRPGAIEHLWQAVPPEFVSQNWDVVLYNRRANFSRLPQVFSIGNGDAEIEPWLALAELYVQDGEYEEAARVYDMILARDNFATDALDGLRNLGLERE